MVENKHLMAGSLPRGKRARALGQTDTNVAELTAPEPPDDLGRPSRLATSLPGDYDGDGNTECLRAIEDGLQDALLDALNEEIAAFICRHQEVTDRHLADALGRCLKLIGDSTPLVRKWRDSRPATYDPKWAARYDEFCRQLLISRNSILADFVKRCPQLDRVSLRPILVWWIDHLEALCLELHNESAAQEEEQVISEARHAMAANAGSTSLQSLKRCTGQQDHVPIDGFRVSAKPQ